MSNGKKRPVIIWSPVKGTWYQEEIDGRLSLSFMDWGYDPKQLEEFCSKLAVGVGHRRQPLVSSDRGEGLEAFKAG
jgi:hypothetical protein